MPLIERAGRMPRVHAFIGLAVLAAGVNVAHALGLDRVVELPACGGSSGCYYDAENIAVLGTGAFGVVRRVNSGVIEALFFDPTGKLLRGPIRVASADESDIYGSIGALGSRYVVTWTTLHEQTAFARVFDEAGSAVGERRRWPVSEDLFPGRNFYFDRGATPVGALFLAHVAGLDQFDNPVVEFSLQRIGPGARLVGGDELLSEKNRRFLPETGAVNDRGDIFAAGSSCPRSPLSKTPCVRSAKLWRRGWGTVLELPLEDLPSLDRDRHLSAVMRPNGRTGLAWVERHASDFGYRDQIRMTSFAANGRVVGTRDITAVESRGIAFPLIRGGADTGDWVVAWLETGPTPNAPIDVWIASVGTTPTRQLVATGIQAHGFGFETSDTGKGVLLFDSTVVLVDVSGEGAQ